MTSDSQAGCVRKGFIEYSREAQGEMLLVGRVAAVAVRQRAGFTAVAHIWPRSDLSCRLRKLETPTLRPPKNKMQGLGLGLFCLGFIGLKI